MAKSLIYHNPRCSTSRKALGALVAAGHEPEIIEYLRQGWTAPQLRRLFNAAGVTARQALRLKQDGADVLAGADEEMIIAAMIREPALVERPFVETAKGARLARPLLRIQDIL